MAVIKESGIEVVPGISIPWNWIDGIIVGIIESGEAGINAAAVVGIDKLDGVLQAFVDNNTLAFDNVAKDKVAKAVTLAMVKKFTPELLNP